MPDKVYLGQKDYQQVKVIQKLTTLLNLDVQVVVAQTRREASGLAMSSRNMRLNAEQKTIAAGIYETLNYLRNHYKAVSFDELITEAKERLLRKGFTKIDYVAIADAETLEQVKRYDAAKKHIALVAAFLGDVRLIDNMLLEN